MRSLVIADPGTTGEPGPVADLVLDPPTRPENNLPRPGRPGAAADTAGAPGPLQIAMIGTRGVPARYGGFETCVEEVGRRLAAAGHHVQVFCRPPVGGTVDERPREYRGMELIQLPVLRRRSLETLAHTALSVVHPALAGADCAIVFNAANAPLLPALRTRGIPVATHVDGLEWRRAKWGPTGRRYYRTVESLAVRWSDALIADAPGIQDYYRAEFDAGTSLIAYGAPILEQPTAERVLGLGLRSRGYHLVVARFEPENHVVEIVQGYVRSGARLPLVVVGSAPYATTYTARVVAAADARVRLLGAVWDQEQLDQLYANCLTYLHGHSVGGTNPSLLRAAGAGACTIAYDCIFNREVLDGEGTYFQTPAQVATSVLRAEADPPAAVQQGAWHRERIRRYDWDQVAAQYEALCRRLADSGPAERPSGWRFGAGPDRAAAVGADSRVRAGRGA